MTPNAAKLTRSVSRQKTLCIVLGAQVLTREGICFAETDILPQGFVTGDFGYLQAGRLLPAENISDKNNSSCFSEARDLLEGNAEFWKIVEQLKAEHNR